jgi:hypothetical protein
MLFAQESTAARQCRRCEHNWCDNWFQIAQIAGRADKMYCSGAHTAA